MLCVRNTSFSEVSEKRSFYKIKEKVLVIKLPKVSKLDR